MKYVAFDLGASSGKLFEGTLQRDKLQLVPIHSFPNGIISLKDGMYWDFMRIYSEMCTGLQIAEGRGHVDAFGIDSYNNDFSLIGRDGTLLMPVRAYRDPRTLKYWNEIFEKLPQRALYMHSGNQIAPYNALMHLAAMNLNGQHFMLENAHRLLMLPDLLAYYITECEGIEYTLAAETELMDLKRRAWIDPLFDLYDIPKRLMPPLRTPGAILGPSTEAFNAAYRLKGLNFINVCEHDTASAFIASPMGGRSILISSGTWALIGTETDAPIIDGFTYRANISNEGGPDGHHRMLRNVMGMWLLQEMKRNYALDKQVFSFAEIAQMAASARPFRFPMDPDAPELYLPGDMRQKIRQISLRDNGVAPETPAEFFRCIYEALAMKYRYVIELIETAVGVHYPSINIFGGGCQDALLNQFAADACDREVLAGPVDASAIGNIAMQMIAMGQLKGISEIRSLVQRSFPIEHFSPMEAAEWNLHYADYVQRFESSR